MRLVKRFSLGLLLSSFGLFFLETPAQLAQTAQAAESASSEGAIKLSAQQSKRADEILNRLLALSEPESAVAEQERLVDSGFVASELTASELTISDHSILLEQLERDTPVTISPIVNVTESALIQSAPVQVSQSLDELLRSLIRSLPQVIR